MLQSPQAIVGKEIQQNRKSWNHTLFIFSFAKAPSFMRNISRPRKQWLIQRSLAGCPLFLSKNMLVWGYLENLNARFRASISLELCVVKNKNLHSEGPKFSSLKLENEIWHVQRAQRNISAHCISSIRNIYRLHRRGYCFHLRNVCIAFSPMLYKHVLLIRVTAKYQYCEYCVKKKLGIIRKQYWFHHITNMYLYIYITPAFHTSLQFKWHRHIVPFHWWSGSPTPKASVRNLFDLGTLLLWQLL